MALPRQFADRIQSRINALSVPTVEKNTADDFPGSRDEHVQHLARLHERERGLLDDPARHRLELIRVRDRCNYAELPFPDFECDTEASTVEPIAPPFDLPNNLQS